MNSESTQLCRLCLETSAGLLNIFETFQDSTIASVLTQHFWFEITKDDDMPKWLCETCWSQTKTFHQFYKRLQLLHSIIVVKDEDEETEQERSDDGSMEKELESELSLDKCDQKVDANIEDTQLLSKEEEDTCLDEGNNDNDNGSSDQSDAEITVKDGPSLSVKEQQDALIREFFRMKCEICSDDVEFLTFRKASKHYRQVHNTKSYLICCGKKFKYRHRMIEHAEYHIDPGPHPCEQCGKSIKSRSLLKIHMKTHEPANLRDYKCDICSKIYTKKAALQIHVQHNHPTDKSEKFPCGQCDRICLSKAQLASHIKYVHEHSSGHVCDTCGLVCKSYGTLLQHKRVEHSTTGKAQCDICGAWVKHKSYLPRHFKWHRELKDAQNGNAEVVECSICKKKLLSKRLLGIHIREKHGKRNHRCSFCDKAFKVLKNLKEHEALHTGVDLYGCTYCDRTFKSNANMYSHRKKVHFEEWTRNKTINPAKEWKLKQVKNKGSKS